MRKQLRSILLGLGTMLGLGAVAQDPYGVYVFGHISACNPSTGGTVTISTGPDVTPPQTQEVTLNSECGYNAYFDVNEPSGTFTVTGMCPLADISVTNSGTYANNGGPGTTTDLLIDLGCDGDFQVTVHGHVSPCALLDNTVTVRCTSTTPWVEAVVPVDGDCNYTATLTLPDSSGTVVAVTGCSNGLVPNNTAQFDVVLGTVTSVELDLSCDTPPTNACFTVAQVAAFTATFTNCSTGCLPPFTYLWDIGGPGGGTQMGDVITYTFPGPGTYAVCLNIAGADGCTGQTCQQVTVGDDGTINPSIPVPCEANFWVVQAYQNDPVSGDPVPLPGELWAWNLSNTGNALAQFLWSFGDGATSTDPYPSHHYDGNGPYELCLTVSTDGGCTNTYCDSVSVDADGIIRSEGFNLSVLHSIPAGITEVAVADLKTWPNPATSELNIGVTSRLKGAVDLTVMDLSGRTVISERRVLADGSNTLHLATDALAPGLYVLRVGDRVHGASQRFVKAR